MIRRQIVVPRHIENLLYIISNIRSGLHELLSKYEYEELLEHYRESIKTLIMMLPPALKKRFKRELENIENAKSKSELDTIFMKIKTAIDRYYSQKMVAVHGYEIEEWLKNI